MWGSANDSLKKACFKDGQNYRNLNRYRVAKLTKLIISISNFKG